MVIITILLYIHQDYVIPVSYTHLDVYKRQSHTCVTLVRTKALLLLNADADELCSTTPISSLTPSSHPPTFRNLANLSKTETPCCYRQTDGSGLAPALGVPSITFCG